MNGKNKNTLWVRVSLLIFALCYVHILDSLMMSESHIVLLVGVITLAALGVLVFFINLGPEKTDRITKRARQVFDRFCRFCELVTYAIAVIFGGGFVAYTFWRCYEEQSFAPAFWIVGILIIAVALSTVFATLFGVWWLLKNFYRVLPLPGKAYRICRVFFSNLSDRQKIALLMSGAAVVILTMALCKNWEWYPLLRWVVCLALVGKLLEKFPAWFKFILIVGAIIYNPIAPIHIGKRNDWLPINWITLPIIVSAEIITIKKAPNNGTPKNS